MFLNKGGGIDDWRDRHARNYNCVKLSKMTNRLAIIPDYPEENWPSIDLCADMLCQYLQAEHHQSFDIQKLQPQFKWRFSKLPILGKKRVFLNTDRLINRFWDYSQYLKKQVNNFDLYFLADHSYAHLVHGLPCDRTGIFCHDLDTFRCLLEPEQNPRPSWFRAMSTHILKGLQKAAIVFYTTEQVRQEIEYYKLVESQRLVHAPLGIAPEFTPNPQTSIFSPTIKQLVQQLDNSPFLLHVGSCIPRKRIDILLDVFALIRQEFPHLSLVKVSGEWTPAQLEQINSLGLKEKIIPLHNLTRETLAALYRLARLVLVTSEAEGFGLPVIEALACGAIVVGSDIPVFREVAANALVYCPVGEIAVWAQKVSELLKYPHHAPNQELRLAQANRYSWSAHAKIISQAYLELLPLTTSLIEFERE